MDTQQWHARFTQQAQWTRPLLQYLLSRIGEPARILEVGCGTGAVISHVAELHPNSHRFGVDLLPERVAFAHSNDNFSYFSAADATRLPFSDASFDLVFCHFFLMWIPQPETALFEMKRVTRKGGWVAALAEPDYENRPTPPDASLQRLFQLQKESLARQGAHPARGKELGALVMSSGLSVRESSHLQWMDQTHRDIGFLQQEWEQLLEDASLILTSDEICLIKEKTKNVRPMDARTFFLPTYYCLATKD